MEKKYKNPVEKIRKIQWRRRPEIADFRPLAWSIMSKVTIQKGSLSENPSFFLNCSFLSLQSLKDLASHCWWQDEVLLLCLPQEHGENLGHGFVVYDEIKAGVIWTHDSSLDFAIHAPLLPLSSLRSFSCERLLFKSSPCAPAEARRWFFLIFGREIWREFWREFFQNHKIKQGQRKLSTSPVRRSSWKWPIAMVDMGFPGFYSISISTVGVDEAGVFLWRFSFLALWVVVVVVVVDISQFPVKAQKIRGKFRSIFREKIRASKNIFRADFVLQNKSSLLCPQHSKVPFYNVLFTLTAPLSSQIGGWFGPWIQGTTSKVCSSRSQYLCWQKIRDHRVVAFTTAVCCERGSPLQKRKNPQPPKSARESARRGAGQKRGARGSARGSARRSARPPCS